MRFTLEEVTRLKDICQEAFRGNARVGLERLNLPPMRWRDGPELSSKLLRRGDDCFLLRCSTPPPRLYLFGSPEAAHLVALAHLRPGQVEALDAAASVLLTSGRVLMMAPPAHRKTDR